MDIKERALSGVILPKKNLARQYNVNIKDSRGFVCVTTYIIS